MTAHTPLLRKLIEIIRRAAAPHAGGLTRREFLGKSAVAISGAMLAAGATDAAVPKEPIAILGAGVAGLTAAYRLGRAGAQVVLFEGSHRIGGRILTMDRFIPAELNDGKPMFCELGGELVDSNHKDLLDLAKELRVGYQELREGDLGVVYYYFEGKIRTDKELGPAYEPLAKLLAKDARGLIDKDWKYTDKAKKFDGISIDAYLQRFKGKVEPWVLRYLDVAFEVEFGRSTKELSALNLITYSLPEAEDDGGSDQSKRVKGGSSRLIEALERAIAGKVKLHLRHRLTAIATDSGGKLRLTFATPEGARSFTFSKTICALPFTMLRGGRVAGLKKLGLSKEKLKAIQELGYGNNTKAMIAFKSRFWRKAEPVNDGSTYSDQSYQCTWECSRKQPGPAGILVNFLGGKTAVKATPDTRFATTLKELDKVFPGAETAYLGKQVMMHWPTQKFVLGSYSCPLVGQVTALLEHCATPELEGRLLFAGEHTSADFPGFMCGGVQSGNRAAKEALARA
jgi:monoamine oxidase